MVFKGRFFSSKNSESPSPDGSSPRSFGSNSPSRSDKKSPKSNFKGESTSFAASCKQTQVKDGPKKKELKGKESEKSNQVALRPRKEATNPVEEKKEAASAVSPILASSLGLNRIKTRSGPLPQESFYGFRGEKGSGLGASNLFRKSGEGGGDPSSGFSKKKEVGFSDSRIGTSQGSAPLSGNWVEKSDVCHRQLYHPGTRAPTCPCLQDCRMGNHHLVQGFFKRIWSAILSGRSLLKTCLLWLGAVL